MAGAADMRDQIERWFTRQGLPLFVQDCGAGISVQRVAPFLIRAFSVLWIIEVVILAPNRNYPPLFNVAALGAGLAMLVTAGWLTSHLASRVPSPAGPGLGAVVFVVTPAAVPVIFGHQLLSAIVTAAWNLALVVVLFLMITGLLRLFVSSLLPLTFWAVRETWRQTFQLLALLAGALPVLIAAIMLLFLTAEVWQMAANLHGPFLLIMLVLFAVLGTLCLLRGLAGEVGKRCDSQSTEDQKKREERRKEVLQRLQDATGKESFLKELLDLRKEPPRKAPGPTTPQRVNIGVVLLFSMSLQIVAVSVAVGFMFLVFGALAIPEETARGFLGRTSGPSLVPLLPEITLWDQPIRLTRELGYVTAFITLFSYLSFVFFVVTHEEYVERFLSQVDRGVQNALMVREIYLTTIWPPRLRRAHHGKGQVLRFEVPAALVKNGDAWLGVRTAEELPEPSYTRHRLSREGDDGPFAIEVPFTAGTQLQYHYEIDGEVWKGPAAGTDPAPGTDPAVGIDPAALGIADPSGTTDLVFSLPSPPATATSPAPALP